MITLLAIIVFILFLKFVGFLFAAGLRILGWLFGGIGFIVSVFLAISIIGIVFDVIPVLLVIGVIALAFRPGM